MTESQTKKRRREDVKEEMQKAKSIDSFTEGENRLPQKKELKEHNKAEPLLGAKDCRWYLCKPSESHN